MFQIQVNRHGSNEGWAGLRLKSDPCERENLHDCRQAVKVYIEGRLISTNLQLRILDLDTLKVWPVVEIERPPFIEYRKTDKVPPDLTKRGTSVYGIRGRDDVTKEPMGYLNRRIFSGKANSMIGCHSGEALATAVLEYHRGVPRCGLPEGYGITMCRPCQLASDLLGGNNPTPPHPTPGTEVLLRVRVPGEILASCGEWDVRCIERNSPHGSHGPVKILSSEVVK